MKKSKRITDVQTERMKRIVLFRNLRKNKKAIPKRPNQKNIAEKPFQKLFEKPLRNPGES
tara:strand:- start:13 stop:192 length:180 start_codon:yes stop_codon:yes gene_type:complete